MVGLLTEWYVGINIFFHRIRGSHDGCDRRRADHPALALQLHRHKSLHLVGAYGAAADRSGRDAGAPHAAWFQDRSESRAVRRRGADNPRCFFCHSSHEQLLEYCGRHPLRVGRRKAGRARRDCRLFDVRLSGTLHADDFYSHYLFLGNRELLKSLAAVYDQNYRTIAGAAAAHDQARGNVRHLADHSFRYRVVVSNGSGRDAFARLASAILLAGKWSQYRERNRGPQAGSSLGVVDATSGVRGQYRER